MAKYVPGSGTVPTNLMVIGEAPGSEEELEGKPFVGMTGKEVRKLLDKNGYENHKAYYTNVFKYHPANNDLKLAEASTGHAIADGIDDLWAEIEQVKPNCILALGRLALRTLTGKDGITQHRGSILRSLKHDIKVVPSFHPSAYLSERAGKGSVDYSARTYVTLDFARAIEESQTSKLKLPERNLMVCRNSLQLYNFFEQNKKNNKLSIDIEVIHAIPTCIGMAFDSVNGLSVPLFSLYDMSFADAELVEMWKLLARNLEDPRLKIIGQNFKFDQAKIRNTVGIRLPRLYRDTMVQGFCLHPELPKSLQFLTSVYTREPYYKDEYKEFNPKKDKIEQIYLYNAKDAVVTFELCETLERELEQANLVEYCDYRTELHDLYLAIEEDGFSVNEEEKKAVIADLYASVLYNDHEMDAILGYKFNCQSNPAVAKALYETLAFPLRKGGGEDVLSALYANHCKTADQKRFLDLLLDRRKFKTNLTTVSRKADYDGKMRGGYNYCGTETGRSSTAILQPPVRPEKIGLTFHGLSKHGEIGKRTRRFLVADPGCVLLEADLSQAEPRIVALLSEDYELLEKFGVTDIHKETAGWFFNLEDKIAQQLKKDDPKRFIGKTGRNGGNYDMGKRRLAQTINTDAKKYGIDVQVSEWKAGEILQIFHAKSPKIRGVFHRDIRLALEANNRTLVNPYGFRRQFLGRWNDDLIKEALADIPQSTVADHLKKAMLRLKKNIPDLRIIIEAHDANVFMLRHDEVKDIAMEVDKQYSRVIDFSTCTLKRGDLIIPAAFEIGESYGELKGYKLAS